MNRDPDILWQVGEQQDSILITAFWPLWAAVLLPSVHLPLFQIAVAVNVGVGACVSGPHLHVGSEQIQGPLVKQCVTSASGIPKVSFPQHLFTQLDVS